MVLTWWGLFSVAPVSSLLQEAGRQKECRFRLSLQAAMAATLAERRRYVNYMKKETFMDNQSGKTCDSRIWCAECQRSEYNTLGDKYLCAACGKELNLGHEVHHEIFPHVSGDKDHLS